MSNNLSLGKAFAVRVEVSKLALSLLWLAMTETSCRKCLPSLTGITAQAQEKAHTLHRGSSAEYEEA